MTCKARGQRNGYGSSGTPQNCVFPFINGGQRYRGCAPSGKGSYCATKVDSKDNMREWARCNKYCKKDKGEFKISLIYLLTNV